MISIADEVLPCTSHQPPYLLAEIAHCVVIGICEEILAAIPLTRKVLHSKGGCIAWAAFIPWYCVYCMGSSSSELSQRPGDTSSRI
jgi:hypothetical protein